MKHCATIILSLLLSTTTVIAQRSPSQTDFVRGGLSWKTLTTEHFNVIFHNDVPDNASAGVTSSANEQIAETIASIAEAVYDPITALYAYEPGRVSIVLKNYDDYSNGAAYFFDNMIDIWVPALNSPLRGDHDWFENVIAHEFTHIVQVQKTLKSGRQNPFQYFQWFGYESVRRPDVLYGYPNRVVTYPVPTISNPAWFAEGTAQYQRPEFDLDRWDSHRDMLLRTRILNGQELPFDEMGGFFSRNSQDREAIYNQGYAFVLHLANVYGPQVLADVSHNLSDWRNYNFDRAFKKATGDSVEDVHRDWLRTLKSEYQKRIRALDADTFRTTVYDGGFSNLHPQVSPDGSKIALLSNAGRDFSTTALTILDADDPEREIGVLELSKSTVHEGYTCSLGHTIVGPAGGSFDWFPDNNRIAFAKNTDTPEGFSESDIYLYELDTKKTTRLTFGARAFDPTVSSDGQSIAYLKRIGSSVTLSVLDLRDNISRDWFTPAGDAQLYEPDWLDNEIVVSISTEHGRDIVAIGPDGNTRDIVATEADERSPSVSSDGEAIYFASDATGIFNLYRSAVGSHSGDAEVITNVVGGAFMPSISEDGHVYYSHFARGGYEIAKLEGGQKGSMSTPDYEAPAGLIKGTAQPRVIDTSENEIDSQTGNYRNVFTSFSFYPVVRLDQYVSRERVRGSVRLPTLSRTKALWRNTKVGFYTGSRDVLGDLSVFAGVLLGPGSGDASSAADFFSPANLLELERDVFIQFEHAKGLFFKEKRWSPRFTAELFNIRRNVEQGLSIEEFSCTACFPPDTTFADVGYNLWQATLTASSKINRHTLAEIGYRFSPYTVITDDFFSTEFGQSIPKSSSRYYIGRTLTARLAAEYPVRHRHADVVPAGLSYDIQFDYEPGRLLDEFEIQEGVLEPVYQQFSVSRLTTDLAYGVLVRRNESGGTHGLRLRGRLSTIIGSPVDDFFNDYIGGLIGARGYPFYSLGGNRTGWLQASYHFPIIPEFRRQVAFLYLDKLYGRLFVDAANAWSGAFPGIDDTKYDVGLELRAALGSFYILPTAVFVSGTYGLSDFDFSVDPAFVTDGTDSIVRYGKSMQYHFGVLFDFNL